MRHAATAAGIALALVLFATLLTATLGFLPQGPGTRPAVATRRGLELLVMGLQMAGVLALAWMKLAPKSLAAEWSLMIVQIGLGLSGTFCAGFESGFALFAGATLVALLLGTALHTDESARSARHRPATAHG
jgi:hypothetical protein